MQLRNACLQELKDSYRAACRAAARHGRNRPLSVDWIEVRQEEIAEFVIWQEAHQVDLRRRHDQAEARRVAKLQDRIAKGNTKVDPVNLQIRVWQPKTAVDFGRSISKQDQMRRLSEIRRSDPDGIGGIPLSILRDQVDIVHKAMDDFYRRVKKGQKPGFPRFKNFDRVRSIACPIGDGIQLVEGKLISKKLWHGAIPMRMHRDLPGKPKAIRLTYDGRFWWSTIACEVEAAEIGQHALVAKEVGVDAGIRRLMTFDDGSFIENPQFFKGGVGEIRRANRKLARAKRASHAYHKAKRALAAIHRRLANRRRTHHHKVSKDLVSRAGTIFIEDLKIKNMMRSAAGTIKEPGKNVAAKRGLNRGLSDASISTLYNMIRYKAESAGGQVIAVEPYNTSQDCSECGGREAGARKKDRYRCSCGADLDSDHNGARNIRIRGTLALRHAA